MGRGTTVSVYLDEDALAALDAAVARRAVEDRANGLTGYQVTSRSSLISRVVTDFLKSDEPACPTIHEIEYAVVPLARKYGAKRVSLFGSYARGEQTPESDIDILLDKGAIHGMQVFDFQDELAQALGRPVDVVTTQGIGERFAARIARDEVVLYAS